jgi:L-iditol 2-dehydrogenase
MQTRAVVLHGVNEVLVEEIPVPDLAPEEVRVRIKYSGISAGMERSILTGQRSDIPFPFISGSQSVGIVEEVGAFVKTLQVGDRVAAGTTRVLPPLNPGWGGHTGMAVVNAGLVNPVPDSVPFEDAALHRLPAAALAGARMANIKAHENVAIVGQGMVGNLLGQIALGWDAFVIASDLFPKRVELSRLYAAHVAFNADLVDFAAMVRSNCPLGADVVVEATGLAENLPLCLNLVREGGRILLQGWYPGNISIDFQQAHRKRVTLLFPGDFEGDDVVLMMLERGKLHIKPLITHILPASQAPRAYHLLVHEPHEVMGMLFDWDQ